MRKPLAWALIVLGIVATTTRTHGTPPRAEPARLTVYVPVIKVNGMAKDEALMMTELLIKHFEGQTAYKVVGSPDDADFVFEGKMTRPARPGR